MDDDNVERQKEQNGRSPWPFRDLEQRVTKLKWLRPKKRNSSVRKSRLFADVGVCVGDKVADSLFCGGSSTLGFSVLNTEQGPTKQVRSHARMCFQPAFL